MEIRYSKKTSIGLVVGLFAILAVGYFATITSGPGISSVLGTELTVTASEFNFDISTDTVKAGEITVTVTNLGTIGHEFMIYKTSDTEQVLAMHTTGGEHHTDDHTDDHTEMSMEMEKSSMEMEKTSMENEPMMGSMVLAEITPEELTAGTTKMIKVALTPGVYEIGCHIPGHYEGGMKTTLEVIA